MSREAWYGWIGISPLVEALKGGPGSGHRGHRGVSGQHGGSAPRQSFGGFAISDPDDPWTYLDEHYPDAVSLAGEDYDEVLIWGGEYADEWGLFLHDDEQAAFKEYTTGDYDKINSPLRNDVAVEEMGPYGDHVKALDKALDRTGLQQATVSFRMLGDDFYEEVVGMEPGSTFVDRGYASSTMTTDLVEGEYYATIVAPKGVKAGYLGETERWEGVSGKGDEVELLFARNTEFRLIGVDEDGYPVLEVVGQ